MDASPRQVSYVHKGFLSFTLRRFAVPFLIIASGIAFRWPSMSYALTEAHAFRQSQTTIMIREYMQHGMWQLSPLPVFGPPWQVPMEFPLFQWTAALAARILDMSPQIAGRVTALTLFELCAVLSAYLASTWFSRRTGLIALVLFQFVPFGYQWGNAPLIEFLPVAAMLLGLACATKYRKALHAPWIVGALAALIVAFLVKPTTAVAWVPAYIAVSIAGINGRDWRALLRLWPLALPMGLGLACAVVWTVVADRVKESNYYLQFLTSSHLSSWNYGTLDQRLNAEQWRTLFSYTEAIFGSLIVFFILLTVALISWKRVGILVGLSLVLPTGSLVFFNLYYMHNYYQCAVFPALIIVVAAGITGVAKYSRVRSGQWASCVVVTLAVLGLSWTSGEGVLISKRQVGGLYTFPLAAEIAEHVPEDQGIIMIGCDWDPTTLYLSGRRGLMIRPDAMSRPVPADWLKNDLGYVALCDPGASPTPILPLGTRLNQLTPNLFEIEGAETR